MKYIKKNPDDIVGVVEQKMKEEWDSSANLEVLELESGGGQVKVTSRGITTGVVFLWIVAGQWYSLPPLSCFSSKMERLHRVQKSVV